MSITPLATDPDYDEADLAAETLRFFADANRLRLLLILAERESCGSDLIEQLGLPQPLVAYNLKRLREARLVRSRRQGQRVYYSIEPNEWNRVVDPIRQIFGVTSFPPEAAFGASRWKADTDRSVTALDRHSRQSPRR